MDAKIEQFILDLIRFQIIKFGEFKLKSGDISPFYIDLRLIPSYPKLFETSIELYNELIQLNHDEFDALAGLMSAGVPFATGVAIREKIPLLQVRSEIKDHGMKRMIEGHFNGGEKVILLDDLISTGASKVPAIEILRDEGLSISSICVLIDRRKKLELNAPISNIPIYSVFNLGDIIQVLQQNSDLEFLSQYDKSTMFSSMSSWLK